MKTILKFVLRNTFRSPWRTSILLVTIALLSGLICTVSQLLTQITYESGLPPESASRLVVRHAASVTVPLPLGHWHQMETIPGVTAVTPLQWITGFYGKDFKTKTFQGYAIDPSGLKLITEYRWDPIQVQAFREDLEGAIVANELMQRFGWKIGDRVTVRARLFPSPLQFDLPLNIRGTYGPGSACLWIHFDHFNDLVRKYVPERADRLNTFSVGVDRPEDMRRVAGALNDLFGATTAPIMAQTEGAFLADFTSLNGNVRFIALLLVAALALAITCVHMNEMAISVRKRAHEFVLLSSIGYRRMHILLITMTESVVVVVAGAIVGVGAAMGFYISVDIFGVTGLVHHLYIGRASALFTLFLSVLIGVITGACSLWLQAGGKTSDKAESSKWDAALENTQVRYEH